MGKVRLCVYASITVSFIVLLFFAYTYYVKWQKERKDRIDIETISASKEVIFKNKLDQWASKVDVWVLTYDKLKESSEKDIKEYQKKYGNALAIIDEYKRKEKDLRSYISFLLQAKDTIYQPIPADCVLKPISTKYINIDFIYNDSLVGVTYSYQARISTLITMSPKLKRNGRKHFPNWGNLPWVGWDKKSITTVDDQNAKVFNQISLEFKK